MTAQEPDSSAVDDAAATPPAELRELTAVFPVPEQDIDRRWLASYPPLVPPAYPYPDVGLTRLLDDAATDFPESVAIDFLGRTLTYRLLHEHVDRLATGLRALGVAKGDRVGIVLPNCPQHVIAFFATLRLGAIVVPIDPATDEAGLAARINDAGCSVLVVLDPVYASVERLKGRLPSVEHVIGTALADYLTPLPRAVFNWRHRRDSRTVRRIPAAEGVLRFTELVRRHAPTTAPQPVAPAHDIALLAYPEASSRRPPRAVMLTHRNLLANAFQVRLWMPDVQAGRETIVCAVGFWRPYGVTTCLSLGALSAATMTLLPSFTRDGVLRVIDKRKPTLFFATAQMIEAIVDGPLPRRHDLTSLRAALCDSATLGADTVSRFEQATGGRLRQGLALREATALTHANPIYGRAKPERIGLPLTDTVCALVDPGDPTRLAAAGSPGRLAIRGPQVMAGYWNRPDDTATALVAGWLLTEFVCEADADGYYCVTGRVGGSRAGDDAAAGR